MNFFIKSDFNGYRRYTRFEVIFEISNHTLSKIQKLSHLHRQYPEKLNSIKEYKFIPKNFYMTRKAIEIAFEDGEGEVMEVLEEPSLDFSTVKPPIKFQIVDQDFINVPIYRKNFPDINAYLVFQPGKSIFFEINTSLYIEISHNSLNRMIEDDFLLMFHAE